MTQTSQTGSQGAQEKAKEALSTVADSTGQVTEQARAQARDVIGEARSQARGLADTTVSEVRDQARTRGQQAAGGLRTFADQLGSLASGNTEQAGPLVDYLEEGRARVNRFAERLDEGPDAVLDDVRRFARQRPMAFLASAGVLGFLAGRMVRAGKAASSSDTGGTAGQMPATQMPATHMPPPGALPPETYGTGTLGAGDPLTTTTTTGIGDAQLGTVADPQGLRGPA